MTIERDLEPTMTHSFCTVTSKAVSSRIAHLAAVVFALVAILAAAPEALAQCPSGITLTAPANQATGVATAGALSWTVTGGSADYFNIYLGEAGQGCSTKLLTTSRGGTSFTVDYASLKPSTTYEWKVEAVKSGCGTNAVSACQTFTTGCPTAGPTLINPAKDAGMADHLMVAFAWDPVFQATGYDVMVTTNGGAASAVGSTSGQDSTLLIQAVPPGQHTWWVEAKFAGGCPPAKSEVWSFGTSCPTAAPTLSYPADGAKLGTPNDVAFIWDTLSGADGYELWLSRNGAAATLLTTTRETADALAPTSFRTTLPGAGNYSWFVKPQSTGCALPQSATFTFTVSDTCPAAPPANFAPAAGAANVPANVAFSWSAPPNMAGNGFQNYQVLVGINGAPLSVVAETVDNFTNVKLPAGTHQWAVRALFLTCPALQSTTTSFTISAPPTCPTVKPVLHIPAAGAVDVQTPVQLEWLHQDGFVAYKVWVSINGAPAKVMATGSYSSMFNGTWVTAMVNLPSLSQIQWWVEGIAEGCATVSSDPATFTTAGGPPNCDTALPTLSDPAPDAVYEVRGDITPYLTFTWSVLQGFVSSYDLTITPLSGGAPIAIVGLTTPFFNASNLDLQTGAYTWTVTAHFANGCPDVMSNSSRFSIIKLLCAPWTIGSGASPADGTETTNQIVTFSWLALPAGPSAGTYQAPPTFRVYARPADSVGEPLLLGTTTGSQLKTALPFGRWVWWVDVDSGTCGATPSQFSYTFTVKKAVVCSTAVATLVTPANGATNVSNPVQFIWNTVNGAVGYQVWLATAGGSPQPVTELLDSAVTSASATVPAGTIEWFVKTFFPGCDPTSSARSSFATASCSVSKPAQLTSPFEGATDLVLPIPLSWTPVTGATSYDLYIGEEGRTPSARGTITVTPDSPYNTRIQAGGLSRGNVTWFIRAHVPNCGPIDSAMGHFSVNDPRTTCTTPNQPIMAVQPTSASAQEYPVLWTPTGGTKQYELQEGLAPDFQAATSKMVTTNDATFSHDVVVDTTYYYRVRSISSCGAAASPWSSVTAVTVMGVPSGAGTNENNTVISSGSQRLVLRTVFVPGSIGPGLKFTATVDQPWMTVSPSTFTLPAEGITLTLTTDPADLQNGTNAGNIILTAATTSAAGRATSNAGATFSIPVTVNVVSPVIQTGKGASSSASLIIPAVASTPGANSAFFQSDVRIANVGADAARYNVFFTPTASSGTRSAQQATVSVAAGQTIALDNVLKNWYGATNTLGVLEIREVASGATSAFSGARTSVASSRTYTNTPDGTFGQFIPAIPVSDFIGRGETLTLVHLASTSQYRTNLGIVEGAGEPATVHVTAYNAAGVVVGGADFNLQAGEQRQYNNILDSLKAASDNARLDLQVTSTTGRITAYASVVDNRTNDPMLVMPAHLSDLTDDEIVVPGVADLDGIARWRTDLRVFNAATAPVSLTMNFYPSGDPASKKTVTAAIAAGETKKFDDVLRSSFGQTNVSGVIHVVAPAGSRITANGRTYAVAANGTYGQFIPGIPHSSGITKDSPPLQLLQLEESPLFRTNVGLVELTGKAVTVELTAVSGDAKNTAKLTVDLKPYEFRQLGQIYQTLTPNAAAYNGRIAVRVIDGDGAVEAYASVIDNRTQDPTYVPAQQ